jgi:hypothetical protein
LLSDPQNKYTVKCRFSYRIAIYNNLLPLTGRYALRKASELSQVLLDVADEEEIQTTAEESSMMSSVTEDSIIHQAMGILHRDFKQVKKLDDVYYSSAEMSVEALQEFVDPFLYTALGYGLRMRNSIMMQEIYVMLSNQMPNA